MTLIDMSITGIDQASDKMSAVETQVQGIVEAIGEDRANVRVLEPKWADLLRNGAVVTPHVSRWRAESALSLEDYGIYVKTKEEERAYRRVMRLGSGFLLPDNERNIDANLERQFREMLPRYAFKTPMGWFMPEGEASEYKGHERGWLYKEFKAEALKLKQKYEDHAKKMYDNWDDLMKQVESDYITIGVQTYDRLEASGKIGMADRETWVKQFVKRRMDLIPNRDAVLASYQMFWDVDVVPLMSAMAQDNALTAQIVAEKGVVSELKKDMLATARKQFEEGIGSFVADVKSQVYALINGVMQDALAALTNNSDKGSLPGSTVRQLRNLIQQVERLNVWDDVVLEGQMGEVRRMLNANAAKATTTGTMSDTLLRIKQEALAVLEELDRVPERDARAVVEDIDPIALDDSIEREGRDVEENADADADAGEDLMLDDRGARE